LKITRVFDLLDYVNNNICFAYKRNDKWLTYSSEEYKLLSDKVSLYLLDKGIKKGDKIISMIENCPEWNFLDMGILQTGAIHISLYPLIDKDHLKYILKQVRPKIVFVSYSFLYKKLTKDFELKKHPPETVLLDLKNFNNNFSKLNTEETIKQKLVKIKSKIKPDDIASIIYTSSSGGIPKGAIHTHKSISNCFTKPAHLYNLSPEYKAMVVLPLSLSYPRWGNYLYQYSGTCIYYSDTSKSIIENFKEIKPDIVALVPYLLKNILDEYSRFSIKNSVSLKSFTGNNIKKFICSGSALPDDILNYYKKAGIPIYEQYGSTETFVATSNSEFLNKKGTVGTALPTIKIKLSKDGEVLIKGSTMMVSYYKTKDKTIDSKGWYHTGDIGELKQGKFLKIISRKNDIFKTASGKFVSPENIELNLKKSPFIKNILVYGINQKFLIAIITPDFNYIEQWCKNKNIYFDNEKFISNTELIKEYESIINQYNYESNALKTEQIKKFILVDDLWSVESGELTSTFKLKRNDVIKKYRKIIEILYK